ncbi:BON domain-containing protein [Micromonospora craniellae]|uniref:BON domain-containing protein n=1 Tax=Micromonospora craniellae TaxID=2294034 RepID=UPI001CC4AB12
MTTAATARTDDRIQRDVLDELDWDAQVRGTDLRVVVHAGVVTLTGAVDSAAHTAGPDRRRRLADAAR